MNAIISSLNEATFMARELIDAVKDYTRALDAKREFEAIHPNRIGKDWDAHLEAVEWAEERMRSLLRDLGMWG